MSFGLSATVFAADYVGKRVEALDDALWSESKWIVSSLGFHDIFINGKLIGE